MSLPSPTLLEAGANTLAVLQWMELLQPLMSTALRATPAFSTTGKSDGGPLAYFILISTAFCAALGKRRGLGQSSLAHHSTLQALLEVAAPPRLPNAPYSLAFPIPLDIDNFFEPDYNVRYFRAWAAAQDPPTDLTIAAGLRALEHCATLDRDRMRYWRFVDQHVLTTIQTYISQAMSSAIEAALPAAQATGHTQLIHIFDIIVSMTRKASSYHDAQSLADAWLVASTTQPTTDTLEQLQIAITTFPDLISEPHAQLMIALAVRGWHRQYPSPDTNKYHVIAQRGDPINLIDLIADMRGFAQDRHDRQTARKSGVSAASTSLKDPAHKDSRHRTPSLPAGTTPTTPQTGAAPHSSQANHATSARPATGWVSLDMPSKDNPATLVRTPCCAWCGGLSSFNPIHKTWHVEGTCKRKQSGEPRSSRISVNEIHNVYSFVDSDPCALATPQTVLDSGCAPYHAMSAGHHTGPSTPCSISIYGALASTAVAHHMGTGTILTEAHDRHGDLGSIQLHLPGSALLLDDCPVQLVSLNTLLDAGWHVDLPNNLLITQSEHTIHLQRRNGLWHFPKPSNAPGIQQPPPPPPHPRSPVPAAASARMLTRAQAARTSPPTHARAPPPSTRPTTRAQST